MERSKSSEFPNNFLTWYESCPPVPDQETDQGEVTHTGHSAISPKARLHTAWRRKGGGAHDVQVHRVREAL